MSRIWAALPLLEALDRPQAPAGTCWWRTLLTPNEDGHKMIVHTDTTTARLPARLGCWEWFDGQDAQLILGVDVFDVRYTGDDRREYLDVLAPVIPTRSGRWQNLTEPADARWPDPGGFTIPTYAFTAYPHTVSLRPAGG